MKRLALLLIIVLGLSARFFFASINLYNFDIQSETRDIEIYKEGKNIYQEQQFYNYTPVFFYVLGFVATLPYFSSLPPYLVIRGFISIVDLLTLFVLLAIARQRKLSEIKTAAFFFLNPVSIIISGYHGQFDNMAILFLLAATYIYGKDFGLLSKTKNTLVWIAATMGLIIKHVILFPFVMFFMSVYKSRIKATVLIGLAVILFLLTFAPVSHGVKRKILNQVFLYRSIEYRYGLGEMMAYRCDKITNCLNISFTIAGKSVSVGMHQIYFALFMGGFALMALLLKVKDPARAALLGSLYFLTFTNGIGAQYLVMATALGALFPTKWFLLFSTFVGLFMLGNSDEVYVLTFIAFGWIVPWIFSTLWFFSELKRELPLLDKMYARLIS